MMTKTGGVGVGQMGPRLGARVGGDRSGRTRREVVHGKSCEPVVVSGVQGDVIHVVPRPCVGELLAGSGLAVSFQVVMAVVECTGSRTSVLHIVTNNTKVCASSGSSVVAITESCTAS